MATDFGVPEHLLQAPQGALPAPPVDTAEQHLPFQALGWEDFERLCLLLAREEGSIEHVQLYGTRGQAQAGIDIYSRQLDGSYVVFQCKHYSTLTAADIEAAVSMFLAGEWADKAIRFVFCTSHSSLATQLARQIEHEAARLRTRDPPIAFQVWDEETLSAMLKDKPKVVLEFFGAPWLERFLPEHRRARADRHSNIGNRSLAGGNTLEDYLDWSSRQLLDSSSTFVGREWMFAHLTEFSRRHACGYLHVVAEAGLGKTALATAIAARYGAPAFFFSEGEGRTRPDRCLNHLSVELIGRYDLEYERLPDRAGEDAGYLSQVLHAAAAKAGEQKETLWLVIDALDEAYSGSDHATVPLPEQLPPGVFVVLTHRPGEYGPVVLPGTGTAQETVHIASDDEHQTRDIAAYLRYRAEQDSAVTSALARQTPPIANDYFVEQLTVASEGNFMYLAYVLDDLVNGQTPALRIDELPRSLTGYYRRMWRVMSQEVDDRERWESLYLPVVERLAVAGEPVTVAWLADHAGQTPHEIQRRALHAWERFLRRSEDPARWRIVHQSFRDFLAEADEIDLRDSHLAIANYYLQPARWHAHEGYAGRHLAGHLHLAGDHRRLFELLDTPSWRTAQLTDDPSGANYLSDVAHAQEMAFDLDEQTIRRDESPSSLLREIGYAIVTAELHSASGQLPETLLVRLLTTQTWTLGQVLAAAKQIPSITERAQALGSIAPHLPEDQRAGTLDKALAAAKQIGDPYRRVPALTGLAPQLPDSERHEALAEALADIAIVGQEEQAGALKKIAPQLSEDLLREAFSIAHAIGRTACRVNAYIALAPHLPEDLLAEGLADLKDIEDISERAYALVLLAPYLSDDLRREALADAILVMPDIEDPDEQVEVLIELARHSPEHLPVEALDIVLTAESADLQADALLSLAPYLSETQRQRASKQAMAAIASIGDPRHQAETLAELAPHLPAAVLAGALGIAQGNTAPDARAEALAALAPLLPKNECERVLRDAVVAAAAIGERTNRVRVLVALIPLLPGKLQADTVLETLAGACAIESSYDRAKALIALAPHLDEDQRDQAIEEALTATMAITEPGHRFSTLAALAPYLPCNLLTTATTIAPFRRTQALTPLATHLSEQQREEAFVDACAIEDPYDRAQALAALAPQLPTDRRRQALAEALAGIATVYDAHDRAYLLGTIAPHLSDDLIADALRSAVTIPHPYYMGQALAALAPQLPDELLVKALTDALAYDGLYGRGQALKALAPELPHHVLAEALTDAFAYEHADVPVDKDDYEAYYETRGVTLTELAAYLPESLLDEALAFVTTMKHPDAQAVGLARLASRLSNEMRTQLLIDATKIKDPYNRARALIALAPHLDEDQRNRALSEAIEAVRDNSHLPSRVHMLTEIARQLPESLRAELLEDALASASSIESPVEKAGALTTLAPLLSERQRAGALADAIAAIIAIDIVSGIVTRSDRTKAFVEVAVCALKLPAIDQHRLLSDGLQATAAAGETVLVDMVEAFASLVGALERYPAPARSS